MYNGKKNQIMFFVIGSIIIVLLFVILIRKCSEKFGDITRPPNVGARAAQDLIRISSTENMKCDCRESSWPSDKPGGNKEGKSDSCYYCGRGKLGISPDPPEARGKYSWFVADYYNNEARAGFPPKNGSATNFVTKCNSNGKLGKDYKIDSDAWKNERAAYDMGGNGPGPGRNSGIWSPDCSNLTNCPDVDRAKLQDNRGGWPGHCGDHVGNICAPPLSPSYATNCLRASTNNGRAPDGSYPLFLNQINKRVLWTDLDAHDYMAPLEELQIFTQPEACSKFDHWGNLCDDNYWNTVDGAYWNKLWPS